jgi:tetratricopeptide (TPR) repeat protein
MSDIEKKEFQEQMDNDLEIQMYLEINKNIDDFNNEDNWVFYDGDKEALKKTIESFSSENMKSLSKTITKTQNEFHHKKDRLKNKSALRAVSVIAIAACVAMVFYFTSLTPNLNDIYIENSSWAELPSAIIRSNDGSVGEYQKQIVEAEKLFRGKNYEKALIAFQDVTENSRVFQPDIVLYIGISQLELNKYNDAVHSFNTLSQSNAIDNHKAYWYLSLVYLKQNNELKTIESLKKVIKKESNFNYKKALSILQKLDAI